jgi:hypothetical protein
MARRKKRSPEEQNIQGAVDRLIYRFDVEFVEFRLGPMPKFQKRHS